MIARMLRKAKLLGLLDKAAPVTGLGPARILTAAPFARRRHEAEGCAGNFRLCLTSSDWGVIGMAENARIERRRFGKRRGILFLDAPSISECKGKKANPRPSEGAARQWQELKGTEYK